MTEPQELDWMPCALQVIKNFEAPGGARLHSYIVTGEEHLQATIGFGTAIPLAKHPMTITLDQAEHFLAQAIHARYQLFEQHVPLAVRQKMTPFQIVAFISWSYNGKGWQASDTFKLLAAGHIDEFFQHAALWFHGEGSKVLAGLVRRRAVELHLATRGEIDRITSARDLCWYTALISVVNQGVKQHKSGRLVWKGDRLIWQLS